MNKSIKPITAQQFTKEFVNDFQSGLCKPSKDDSFVFNKNILQDDPDLKILNTELSKVGYILKPTKSSQRWTLKKLN